MMSELVDQQFSDKTAQRHRRSFRHGVRAFLRAALSGVSIVQRFLPSR